ncbi:hypothetical protein [Leptospira neocaledonica]|uniref:Uncharacterized protein n=1 Tax=Leptospira neocaledonica TaxID=2023192 RepID=A0A2N0A0D9_9LEPT|nr:hypothetical protein [Leptospira neocaledonica]PJZ77770.1 hypothetical protein CH365_04855 [Leptospira neocaledonica]
MKRFQNSNKTLNVFSLFIHGCFLFSFLLLQACNNAKAISIDASSSAIGALLSDGNFGIFGNFGDPGGTSPAATSAVNISLSGYVNVTSNDLNLTLSDSTDSTTQTLTLTADGSYAFSTELTDGDSYSISLGTYTQGQTCSISTNASGTAGTTGTATIVCERQLAIAAGWKSNSGTPALRLFGVDHSGPYSITKNFAVTVGGAPSSVDPELVWNGTNYLLVWKSADTTIKGQYYDISLTAVGSTFTIYTGAGVTIGKVSAAYNPSGEFAVVWTETASIRAAKYQRINASTGALVGTATTIVSSTSTSYSNADVVWNGSSYTTAFRQKTSSDAYSLTAFSFSTGSATSVKTYTATNGTDSLVLDYPSLLMQGTNTWLFYSQTNTDGSGNVNSSTLKSSKNFQTTPATMITETNPYGCDPVNSSGDQYMIPSVAIANSTTLLLSYDSFCADMGVYNEVSDLPVTIASGTGIAGSVTNYSYSQITTGSTMGSSITCRTTTCFMSVGDEYADFIYLFDPDFTGGDNATKNVYSDSSGGIESPVTVIQ